MMRYRARSRFQSLPILFAIACFIAARWWWGTGDRPSTAPPLLPEGEHAVRRVVDGDTLELAGNVRVRLLGVDTPETVAPERPAEAWGAEASEFTKAFVAAGAVRFTFDRERVDRYGRQLAFVWRGDELLNERLIAEGLSPAVTMYPFSPAMKDRFRAAEREAKRKKIGIWSKRAEVPVAASPASSAVGAARR